MRRRWGRPAAHSPRSSIDLAFDAIAVRLKAEEVADVRVTINWHFTDVDERWVLGLEHHALHATPDRQAADADVTITTTRTTFLSILAGSATFVDAVGDGRVGVVGDLDTLRAIFEHLDEFAAGFNIVEP